MLARSGCSLLVSTYQAGQLLSIGVDSGKLTFDFHRFDQVMGVAVGQGEIAVGVKGQVWFLRDHSELAPRLAPAGHYDRCFLPRTSTATGVFAIGRIATRSTRLNSPTRWIASRLAPSVCSSPLSSPAFW